MSTKVWVIEGPDGAGKTTLALALAKAEGATYVRLPGGTEFGERMRAILKDPAVRVKSELAMAAAFVAVDEEGHQDVRDRVEAGEKVVLDRCAVSNWVYRMASPSPDGQWAARWLAQAFSPGGGMTWTPLAGRTTERRILLLPAPDVRRRRLREAGRTAPDRFDGQSDAAARWYEDVARFHMGGTWEVVRDALPVDDLVALLRR